MIVGVPKETYPGERQGRAGSSGHSHSRQSWTSKLLLRRARAWRRATPTRSMSKGRQNSCRSRRRLFAPPTLSCRCSATDPMTSPVRPIFLSCAATRFSSVFCGPSARPKSIQEIAAAGVTAFSVELVPRTTRAQSMDALSSMGTICGYKAVLIAAETSIEFFP